MSRKILVLPGDGIGPEITAEAVRVLEALNKDVAIVVVTHDLFSVSRYVKSVACVNHGLHYHSHEELEGRVLETMYACSVEDVCRVQMLNEVLPRAEQKSAGDADGNP